MLDLSRSSEIPDPLLKPQRESLADKIADLIAKAISTRHIEPGSRIVETTLAERLGVSRVPIREALKVLHAQGILTGGGHRGYHVATYGPVVTQEITETRLMLERFLLRDAIENWRNGIADVKLLEEPLRDMRRAAKTNDIAASLVADLEFHRVIREASGNAIVGTLWDALSRHVMIVFNFERYRDTDLRASTKQHEEFHAFILQQIAQPTTPEDLNAALENHILWVARLKPAKEAAKVPAPAKSTKAVRRKATS
jgi:DNA-binding GntR family transcriptional regulator